MRVFKIEMFNTARAECGHRVTKGERYFLVDGMRVGHTFCERCGREKGLESMWGERRAITSTEMSKHWFGGERIEEVVCKQLTQYIGRYVGESKREEMLERAVEV